MRSCICFLGMKTEVLGKTPSTVRICSWVEGKLCFFFSLYMLQPCSGHCFGSNAATFIVGASAKVLWKSFSQVLNLKAGVFAAWAFMLEAPQCQFETSLQESESHCQYFQNPWCLQTYDMNVIILSTKCLHFRHILCARWRSASETVLQELTVLMFLWLLMLRLMGVSSSQQLLYAPVASLSLCLHPRMLLIHEPKYPPKRFCAAAWQVFKQAAWGATKCPRIISRFLS